ncbi:MAG: type I-E CRISPR-associated protein Cas5/CasD [Candidatus Kapaibacterium sp.]
MYTLLMRLRAPMQSWGDHSRFIDRDTGREPTKSGVIGLICAAMGIPREGDISHLSAMRFGIRVNREGRIKTDFHTAGKSGYIRAKGAVEKEDLIVTHRHFLADADFLAGFESQDSALLDSIHRALRSPVWDLYLGRKSFTPSLPVYIKNGVVNKNLIDALAEYPIEYQRQFERDENYKQNNTIKRRFAVEDADLSIDNAIMTRTINDQPLSFGKREFMPRNISIFFKDVPVTRGEKNVSE